jgi:hypothetical protein
MERMQLEIANDQDKQLVRAWIQHLANELMERDPEKEKCSPKRLKSSAAESQPCTGN